MSRSHRGVGALTCLMLCGSLILGACSSGGSKAGGTIPPVSSAGAGGSSTASAATSGGASAATSAVPTALDAQALTDTSIGYYVNEVPQGLDATQTQVVLGFLAHDRATWERYRDIDGDLSAVEASTTGEALESYRKSYREVQEAGLYEVGTQRTTIYSVDLLSGSEAVVDLCSDQTQGKEVSSSGEDRTQAKWQHSSYQSATVKLVEGTWKVASLDRKGTDIC